MPKTKEKKAKEHPCLGKSKHNVFYFRGENPEATVPTWGFINKEWKMGSWNIVFYDLGGARKIRKIWERYYAEVRLTN